MQLLNQTAQQNQFPVYLKILRLGGRKGDPLGRVERVCQERAKLKKEKIRLRGVAIFMDSDQADDNPESAGKARLLAVQNEIQLIWQDPCHEAFLLRHLPGCASRSPATCKLAGKALQKVWPEYEKPMTMLKLSKRIDLEAFIQASQVERAQPGPSGAAAPDAGSVARGCGSCGGGFDGTAAATVQSRVRRREANPSKLMGHRMKTHRRRMNLQQICRAPAAVSGSQLV